MGDFAYWTCLLLIVLVVRNFVFKPKNLKKLKTYFC